ncbi:MAG: RNA methyltransferase [Pseudomonadota bacterium]
MTELTIEAMGARGEGVAHRDGARVYVPYALPGERVRADVHVDRARITEVIDAAPDRMSPACGHFGKCGGCLLQHWSPPSYARWKRQLVVDALSRKGLSGIEVSPLVDAHGAGRRRVTLTVANGKAGFSAHRSHDHVPIDTCPVLVPKLARAPEIAVALVAALKLKKTQRVHLMASDTGVDCDLAGVDDPDLDARVRIADVAEEFDLARVCASGDMLIERVRPVLDVGGTAVTPPPGGFAQATAAGETALAQIVIPALARHPVVADLFCGWGAFGLRLAKTSRVLAADSDKAAIAALQAAMRGAAGLKPLIARAHDLMRDPLTAPELKGVTAAVFDPPRAGAARQAAELAAAEGIRTVVGVSCDAGTFARDAGILVEGGLRLDRVVPVDQFRYSAHVEMVGVFSR